MAKNIKILGQEFPKWGVGVVVVGGGVAVWYAYKQKQAAAASASTSSSSVDPVTGLPYSMDTQQDPITGQTYLAEAQQYGSVAAAEQAYQAEQSGLYSTAANYGSSGYYGNTGLGGIYSSDTAAATTYASNAQWAQAVTAGLTDLGYSATDVGSALGAYLGGLQETTAQASIVQTALAEYGPPPSGSYQIIMASQTTSTGSGTGTSTGSGSTGTGSTGTGTSSGSGTTAPAQAYTSGGHVVSINNNDAVVAWTGHNAVKYQGVLNGPGFNNKTTEGTATTASFSGLQAGHDYVFTITPYNSAGQAGQPGSINLVTTR